MILKDDFLSIFKHQLKEIKKKLSTSNLKNVYCMKSHSQFSSDDLRILVIASLLNLQHHSLEA